MNTQNVMEICKKVASESKKLNAHLVGDKHCVLQVVDLNKVSKRVMVEVRQQNFATPDSGDPSHLEHKQVTVVKITAKDSFSTMPFECGIEEFSEAILTEILSIMLIK